MYSLLAAIAMYLSLQGPPAQAVGTPPGASRRLAAHLPLAQTAKREWVVPARPGVPIRKNSASVGVVTEASSAVVVDWRTGALLFAKSPDAPQSVASLTKLMTALVVLGEHPDWDKVVEMSPDDERPGGVPYLATGEQVTVRDLFNLSLVASANGATVALARSTNLSPEAFAAKLNDTATRIGMTHAAFVEPTGLDPANSASARDVAQLLRAALLYPRIKETVLQREYAFTAKTGAEHKVRSTDELLGSFLEKSPYVFHGGKTGYLDEAGYCFSAAASRDGNTLIAVVLGAKTKDQRFKEVKDMLYWAFENYRWSPSQLSGL